MQEGHTHLWFVGFLVSELPQSAVYLCKPPGFAMNSRVVVDMDVCSFIYGLPYSPHQ